MAREGFLDRWSRVKREGEAPEETPPEAEAPAPAPEDDRPDEEILAELGLPHPEELKPGDDIRGFMEAAVPDRLRRLALRRLWRSNPVLANVDGLVEYGEDYTDAATVVENLQTVYQVGKGMVRDLIEDDEAEETPEDAEPQAAEPLAESAPAEDEEPAPPPEAPAEIADAAVVEEAPAIAPTRRRMTFT